MPKVRVLVAEDNQAMLDVVSSELAAEFDVVGAVSDGGSAVSAATELMPEVAVLDLSMPVLNGIEVTRRLRSSGQHIQIVLLSVQSDPEIALAALAEGASGYVLKSQLGTDLVRAIHMALQGEQFLSPGIECEYVFAGYDH